MEPTQTPAAKPPSVWRVLIWCLIQLALFGGAGYWACGYLNFGLYLNGYHKAAYVGGLDSNKRKAFAQAYLDPEAALRQMDQMMWSGVEVMTPFVEAAPKPGRYGTAYINAAQFRADRELQMPKPPGVVRVFLTGGSTALSVGAPDNQTTIGGYLQAMLNKDNPRPGKQVEVFTAASVAWTSTHERILIENRLCEMQPDLVISFSGTNDMHWASRKNNILWFRAYADQAYFEVLNRAYAFSHVGRMEDPVRPLEEPASPELVAGRLARNVSLSAYCLSQSSCPLLFVLQPNLCVTGKALSAREQSWKDRHGPPVEYFRTCSQAIRERLAAMKAPNYRFHDLSGVFDSRPNTEEIFFDAYHFGDRGNQMIAQAIAAAVRPILAEGPATRESR